MRTTVGSKQFKPKRNGVLGALIKGIVWGWLLSFLISISYWLSDGFDMANNRLSNMVHAEALIVGSYSNPAITEYITSTTNKIKTEIQAAKRNSNANKEAWQIKMDVNSIGVNGFLEPAIQHIRKLEVKSKVSLNDLCFLLKNNTLMVLGKILLLTLALPLLVLSWIFGVVDGFTLREVRTAELGRESSFIFHRFLSFVPGVLLVLVAIYIVVPMWINPVLFIVCASILILMLTTKTVSKFKKYV